MNAIQTATRPSTARNRRSSFLVQALPTSGPREPRIRDFGIGYGNSSGYATSRRYASSGGETRFRFA